MPRVAVIPEPNAPVEVREVSEPQLEENSALLADVDDDVSALRHEYGPPLANCEEQFDGLSRRTSNVTGARQGVRSTALLGIR
jgi:hypothetical protein